MIQLRIVRHSRPGIDVVDRDGKRKLCFWCWMLNTCPTMRLCRVLTQDCVCWLYSSQQAVK